MVDGWSLLDPRLGRSGATGARPGGAAGKPAGEHPRKVVSGWSPTASVPVGVPVGAARLCGGRLHLQAVTITDIGASIGRLAHPLVMRRFSSPAAPGLLPTSTPADTSRDGLA